MAVRKDGKPRVFDPVKKKNRFIAKARAVHGNKYEYLGDYENCKKHIVILCSEHGEFLQTPDSHLQGAGCSYCRDNKGGVRYSTQQVVERCKDVHGNTYDYSGVRYTGSKEKIEIKCSVHGSFYQTLHSHLNGSGCPKCVGKFKSEDSFIEDLKQQYDDTVIYVAGFKNMTTKCKFRCNKHGEFSSKPSQVLKSRNGCRVCANESIGKSLSTGVSSIAKNVESTGKFQVLSINKGDGFSYNSKSKVVVKCVKHGTIEERPYNTLLKSIGCSVCLFEHKRKTRTYDNEKFVSLAKDVHGDRYDYSISKYVSSDKRLDVICREHGVFSISPNAHLSGRGCSYCSVNYNGWSREPFIKYVNEKHSGVCRLYILHCYDKNGEVFLKVGRTCRTLSKRFSSNKEMPYSFDVIYNTESSAEDVFDTERKIKKLFFDYKYSPKIDFGGKTECFKVEALENILTYVGENFNVQNSK